MAAVFKTPPQTLASLTSIYHSPSPPRKLVGAAMILRRAPGSAQPAGGTAVGALASGLATGPESFLFRQFLLVWRPRAC
jgi:hypothetical protein